MVFRLSFDRFALVQLTSAHLLSAPTRVSLNVLDFKAMRLSISAMTLEYIALNSWATGPAFSLPEIKLNR